MSQTPLRQTGKERSWQGTRDLFSGLATAHPTLSFFLHIFLPSFSLLFFSNDAGLCRDRVFSPLAHHIACSLAKGMQSPFTPPLNRKPGRLREANVAILAGSSGASSFRGCLVLHPPPSPSRKATPYSSALSICLLPPRGPRIGQAPVKPCRHCQVPG